jgi:tetratricopeptide (TPR) repeat protein
MHEIHELERRWLRYKIKKTLKPFFGVIGAAVLFVGGFFVYDFLIHSQKAHAPLTSTNEPSKVQQNAQVQTRTNEQIVQKQSEEKSIAIVAYEPDLSRFETAPSEVKIAAHEPAFEETVALNEQTQAEPVQQIKQQPEPQEQVVVQEQKKEEVNITKSKTAFDPLEYEKKFNETNDIKFALFLANYYYDKKNYEASYKWAYTINQIHPTNEDGWLFFAKSLYKLEKKEDAIKVLRTYLRHYNSNSAQKLLSQIVQGVL